MDERKIVGVLQIHFFSDLHGWIRPHDENDPGGLEKISWFIKENSMILLDDFVVPHNIPINNVHNLVILSGDIFSTKSPYCELDNGELMVACLKHIGIDGFCLGNHEFYFGMKLQQILQSGICKRAFITKNIVFPEIRNHLSDSFVFRYNDIELHFLGLITDTEALVNGDKADPPVEAALQYFNDMNKDREIKLIPVTHMLMREDIELMNRLDDIDLIIAGHDHGYFGKHPVSDKRHICRTKIDGQGVGSILICFYNDDNHSIREPELHDITGRARSDKELKNLIDNSDIMKKVRELQSQFYISKFSLNRDESTIWRKDTDLGLSMARLFHKYSSNDEFAKKIDIVLFPVSAIRDGFDMGRVTLFNIRKIFSFNNELITFNLKGSDIREILKMLIYVIFGHEEELKATYLCLSGIKVSVKKSGNNYDIINIEVGGNELEDEEQYRILSTSYYLGMGKGEFQGLIKNKAMEVSIKGTGEQDVLKWGLENGMIEFVDPITNPAIRIEEVQL